MNILFEYDESVDAAYLGFSDAHFDHQENLDDLRVIDFAADGEPIGVELLLVSRGADLSGLPFADEIERVLVQRGFPVAQPA